MAVDNYTVIIGLGLAFAVWLYTKNKLLGGMGLVSIGITILSLNTNNATNAIGMIILAFSLITIILDLTSPKKKKFKY